MTRDAQNLLGGHDHNRELHARGNVGDRAVGRKRLHDVGVIVDGVDRPVEIPREDVVKDSSAHRVALSRCTDHCHRARLEKAADSSDGGKPLALIELRAALVGQRCRQLELDHIGRGVHLDRETR